MNAPLSKPCTAFAGNQVLSSGPLTEVALAVKAFSEHQPAAAILVFDDATGRVIDLDLRGTSDDVIVRLTTSLSQGAAALDAEPSNAEPRGRGRPKLGVVGREVTLLPRQWEWLSAQPGGASVVLRKLVNEARRAGMADQTKRAAQHAAYAFMSAMAGDLPGFEEASRALFANDRARFEQQVAGWPDDVRAYATRLAFDV